jgi:heme A synthase
MRVVASFLAFVIAIVSSAVALFGLLSIGTTVPIGLSLFLAGLGIVVTLFAILLLRQRPR